MTVMSDHDINDRRTDGQTSAGRTRVTVLPLSLRFEGRGERNLGLRVLAALFGRPLCHVFGKRRRWFLTAAAVAVVATRGVRPRPTSSDRSPVDRHTTTN